MAKPEKENYDIRLKRWKSTSYFKTTTLSANVINNNYNF